MGKLIDLKQAEDRLHRAGRTRPVVVHTMTMGDVDKALHERLALRGADGVPDHRIAKVRRARWSFLIWALIAGAFGWYIVAATCLLALFFTRQLVYYAYPV